MSSALKLAKFKVVLDALYETFNAEHGFEANSADLAYSIKDFEDRGIKLKFFGY